MAMLFVFIARHTASCWGCCSQKNESAGGIITSEAAGNPEEIKPIRAVIDSSLLLPLSAVALEAEPFAEGATAEIFRGRYAFVDIAAKRVLKGSDILSNFEREVSILSKLHHPGVIAFYGVCQTDDELYMILELCGGDLLSYYQTPEFDLPEFIRVVHETLSAITFLHYREISHRDLKPSNVRGVLLTFLLMGAVTHAVFGVAALFRFFSSLRRTP